MYYVYVLNVFVRQDMYICLKEGTGKRCLVTCVDKLTIFCGLNLLAGYPLRGNHQGV